MIAICKKAFKTDFGRFFVHLRVVAVWAVIVANLHFLRFHNETLNLSLLVFCRVALINHAGLGRFWRLPAAGRNN